MRGLTPASASASGAKTEATGLLEPRGGSQLPWRVALLAVVASLNNVAFGYDVGIVSSSLADMASSLKLTTFQQEAATSGLNYVSALGALLLSGNLLDRIGRKTMLLYASALLIVGAIFVAAAPSLPLLLLGRSLQGLASGCAWCATCVYIAEIAPARWRGGLVSISDIGINAGILLGFVLGRLVNLCATTPDARWRISMALAAALPLLYCACHAWLPETPRWLAMVGREAEATAVLRSLDPHLSEKDAAAALAAIRATLPPADAEALSQGHGQSSWRESLGLGANGGAARRRAAIAIMLGGAQQLTGTEAILYYTPRILRQCAGVLATKSTDLASAAAAAAAAAPAGFVDHRLVAQPPECVSGETVFLVTLAVGTCKLLGEVLIAAAVDRVGRRGPMAASALLVSLSAFGMGAFFATHAPVAVGGLLLCLTMLFFSLGPGPLTTVLINEMLPLSQRGKVMGAAAALNRMTSGTVALTFLTLKNAIGEEGAFGLYASLGLAVAAFYWCCVPDMTGRSLEEA